jgi:membrane-associated phospholipid phosphatase
MDPLQEFGIQLIQSLQQLSPALDSLMAGLSAAGRIEGYLIVIPFIYLAVDRRIGFNMLVLLSVVDTLTRWVKLAFHQPRPYWIGGVKALAEETSYGIPSGHASVTLAVYGYLAYMLRKTWLWILIIVFIVMVGISRLYLGVHFPHDVLAGWALALLVLWVYIANQERVGRWAGAQTFSNQILLSLIVSLSIIVLDRLALLLIAGIPDAPEWAAFATQARSPIDAYSRAGGIFGVLAGYACMLRFASFDARGAWLHRILRYLIAVILGLGLFFGLDILFSLLAEDLSALGLVLRYVRYAISSLWLTFLAPWLFLKIRLAQPLVS